MIGIISYDTYREDGRDFNYKMSHYRFRGHDQEVQQNYEFQSLNFYVMTNAVM